MEKSETNLKLIEVAETLDYSLQHIKADSELDHKTKHKIYLLKLEQEAIKRKFLSQYGEKSPKVRIGSKVFL